MSNVPRPAGMTNVHRLVRSFWVINAIEMAPIRWKNDLHPGDKQANVNSVTKNDNIAV